MRTEVDNQSENKDGLMTTRLTLNGTSGLEGVNTLLFTLNYCVCSCEKTAVVTVHSIAVVFIVCASSMTALFVKCLN